MMELIPNYLQVISWEESLTSELKMGLQNSSSMF